LGRRKEERRKSNRAGEHSESTLYACMEITQ
jgi:hypothetical protein